MRFKAEWLLLPLFALPLLLALGLHLWASETHEQDLDVYRDRGSTEVERILMQDPLGGASAWALVSGWSPHGEAPNSIVRVGTRTVSMDGWPDFNGNWDGIQWTFTEAYPVGIAASALANADTRLKIAMGVAPATLPSIDEPTSVLRDLLRRPDKTRGMEKLRLAPLPPWTKAFVLGRWLQAEDDEEVWQAHALVSAVARIASHIPTTLGPGYHTVAGTAIAVPRTPPHPVHVYRAPKTDLQVIGYDKRNPSVRVRMWSRRAAVPPGETLLWQERLEEPLAGSWMLSYAGSLHWSDAPRFEGWVGASVAGLLLLLAVPVALWFALRRRRKLDEARTRFINELAHDLRTPLTSLRLHAEMLGSGRTPEDRRGHYLGLIERESSRLSALLGNLLDLSRLDGARAPLHPQSMTVASAVEQALHAFVAVHPDRAKDLTLTGDEDVTVQADAAALARVLGNLLDNAGKFTEAGTPIRIGWAPAGAHVQVTVSDDGPGIPPDEQRTIFDRYSRGASAKKDGVAGSGLGLALVKELTTRMDGSIRLQPTQHGATFRIRLPKGDDA